MRIGELAQIAQCTVETIRYYERQNLLPEPERTTGNFRCYGSSHLERLRFIRNCRALDMTHGEIRTLLTIMDQPTAGCGQINALLDEHMGHVDARIGELQQLKQQLHELRHRCQSEKAVEDCGILQGLVTMEIAVRPERHTHLG